MNCKRCGIKLTEENWPIYFKKKCYYRCRSCKNEVGRKKAKENNIKRYGITLIEFDEMFKSQNGVCAICGKPETGYNQHGIRRLCIDHDHNTGRIRGLLCGKCNHMLGLVGDSVEVLKAAIKFLGSA